MRKRVGLMILISGVMIAGVFLSGCGNQSAEPTPMPDYDGEEDPFIGMPNPASFYCQEMGYNLELTETSQGTVGICSLPNDLECEEWEFLAGGCGIEWTFCARQGHTPQPGDGMAICTFSDGSTCPEYDFFIGECLPPE
jgi:putative hemolysin